MATVDMANRIATVLVGVEITKVGRVWRNICGGHLDRRLSMLSLASVFLGAISGAQWKTCVDKNGQDDSPEERAAIHEAAKSQLRARQPLVDPTPIGSGMR